MTDVGSTIPLDEVRRHVETSIRDPELCHAVAGLFADAVTHANALSRTNWTTSFRHGALVRLNVGRIRVLDLREAKALFVLAAGALDPSLQDSLESRGADIVPERFVSLARRDASLTVSVPWDRLANLLAPLRSALLEGVSLASTTAEFTPYGRAHTPAVLTWLSHETKRELPEPQLRVTAAPGRSAPSRRYWKIAPGEGASEWEVWKNAGYAAVGWELGDLTGIDRAGFDRFVEVAQRDNPESVRGIIQLWQFRNIPVGSLLVANRGTRKVVGIGEVTRAYYYEGGPWAHRLGVRWFDTDSRHVHEPGWIKTLIELDESRYAEIVDAPIVTGLPDVSPLPPAPANRPRRYMVADFVNETRVQAEDAERWQSILRRKQQVILQGPPGTGKTYIATRLAKLFTAERGGIVEIVQFHPSYAYEDFMQGLRPEVRDGSIRYEMRKGRLLEFCDRACLQPDAPCVLIIDEINRANLPRVFGELMYLLEHRDDAVPLAGGGTFALPKNVHLLGTMNTADRSVTRIDHALRRRFAFVRIEPDHRVLREYFGARALDAGPLVNVLSAIDSAIGDRNFSLGTSFFLREDIAAALPDVWRGEIEPYLEELFYDRRDVLEQFTWDTLEEGRFAGYVRADEH